MPHVPFVQVPVPFPAQQGKGFPLLVQRGFKLAQSVLLLQGIPESRLPNAQVVTGLSSLPPCVKLFVSLKFPLLPSHTRRPVPGTFVVPTAKVPVWVHVPSAFRVAWTTPVPTAGSITAQSRFGVQVSPPEQVELPQGLLSSGPPTHTPVEVLQVPGAGQVEQTRVSPGKQLAFAMTSPSTSNRGMLRLTRLSPCGTTRALATRALDARSTSPRAKEIRCPRLPISDLTNLGHIPFAPFPKFVRLEPLAGVGARPLGRVYDHLGGERKGCARGEGRWILHLSAIFHAFHRLASDHAPICMKLSRGIANIRYRASALSCTPATSGARRSTSTKPLMCRPRCRPCSPSKPTSDGVGAVATASTAATRANPRRPSMVRVVGVHRTTISRSRSEGRKRAARRTHHPVDGGAAIVAVGVRARSTLLAPPEDAHLAKF